MTNDNSSLSIMFKCDIIQQCPMNSGIAKAFVNDMEHVRDLVSQAASDAFIPALQRLIDEHHHHGNNGNGNGNGGVSNNESLSVSLMKKKNGQSYSTISSIVNDAVNLEHFHVYSKQQPTMVDDVKDDKDLSPMDTRTLEWHTDGGLFLAFFPA